MASFNSSSYIGNNRFNSTTADVSKLVSSGSLDAKFRSISVVGLEPDKNVSTDSSGNFVGTDPTDLSNLETKTQNILITTTSASTDFSSFIKYDGFEYASLSENNQLPPKEYVDNRDNLKLDLSGGTMSGNINFSDNKATFLANPTDPGDAVNKSYLESITNPLITKTTHQSENGGFTDFNSFLRYDGFEYTPTENNEIPPKEYVDNRDNLKLDLSGGTLSGNINFSDNKATFLANPTDPGDAVNKSYLESITNPLITKTTHQSANGGFTDFNSFLRYNGFVYDTPTSINHITPKAYVDTRDNLKLDLSGGVMSGNIDFGGNKATGLSSPTNLNDAVNLNYLDTVVNPLITKTQYIEQTPVGSTTISSPLIVNNTIKLNNNIFDSNNEQSYILKKRGVYTWVMGPGATTGNGQFSMSIGWNAGSSSNDGSHNIVIGQGIGRALNTYHDSVLIGVNCANNISATYGGNVVVGSHANETGICKEAVYIGHRAGQTSTGERNICIGYQSGTGLTSGPNCVFIGTDTGSTNGTQGEQIAIGWNAQTTAVNQVVIGSQNIQQFQSNGFRDLDTKSANVIGIGKTNATAIDLWKNTTINGTIKLTGNILDINNEQSYILKKGSQIETWQMGPGATTGNSLFSISIGRNAGSGSNTGADNIVIGRNVGQSSTSYNDSVLIGTNCATSISPSYGGNVCIGSQSNRFGTCKEAVYVGNKAGLNSTGERNICIGHQSGTGLTSGPNCVFIGTDTGSSAGTQGEQIAIGWNAQTTAVNQVVIGSQNIQQFQSNGFRDLDTKSANIVIGIGKTNATAIDLWKNTKITGNLTVTGNINGLTPIGGLFAQTQISSVKSFVPTTEYSLISPSIQGSKTIPANTLKVGDTFQMKFIGRKTCLGNNRNLQINIYLGNQDLLIAQSQTSLPSMTQAYYTVDILMTISSSGAEIISTSGTFHVSGVSTIMGISGLSSINFGVDNTFKIGILQSQDDEIFCDNLVVTKIY